MTNNEDERKHDLKELLSAFKFINTENSRMLQQSTVEEGNDISRMNKQHKP